MSGPASSHSPESTHARGKTLAAPSLTPQPELGRHTMHQYSHQGGWLAISSPLTCFSAPWATASAASGVLKCSTRMPYRPGLQNAGWWNPFALVLFFLPVLHGAIITERGIEYLIYRCGSSQVPLPAAQCRGPGPPGRPGSHAPRAGVAAAGARSWAVPTRPYIPARQSWEYRHRVGRTQRC